MKMIITLMLFWIQKCYLFLYVRNRLIMKSSFTENVALQNDINLHFTLDFYSLADVFM